MVSFLLPLQGGWGRGGYPKAREEEREAARVAQWFPWIWIQQLPGEKILFLFSQERFRSKYFIQHPCEICYSTLSCQVFINYSQFFWATIRPQTEIGKIKECFNLFWKRIYRNGSFKPKNHSGDSSPRLHWSVLKGYYSFFHSVTKGKENSGRKTI